MSYLKIDIVEGNSEVTSDDLQRAEDAALRVLDRSGCSVEEIYAEFKRQWAEFDDYTLLTGLARVWVEAEESARVELTAGWRNPGEVGCYISA